MPQTVEDLGKLVKQKYPQYQSVPDAELGRKVKAKYPQYSYFADLPQESTIDRLKHDAAIGWRSGVSELEHTAGNAANLVGAKRIGERLNTDAKQNAPTASEIQSHQGLSDQVVQGVAGAVPQIAEYAPAMLAKKWAPVVAGVIGAIGAADKGKKAALTQGVLTAGNFYAMGKAAKLPSRGARALGSAAIGAGTAALEGADAKGIAAGAVMGGAMGAVTSDKHAKAAAAQPAKQQNPFLRGIVENFSPRSLGKEADVTGQHLRSELGVMRRKGLVAETALRGARDAFDHVPLDPTNPGGISQPALDFIHAIQTDNLKAIPTELHPFAKEISKLYDERWKELHSRGLIDSYVEHYFSQIWQHPEKAQEVYRVMSRRPLQGSERFTHRRVFATVQDGINYAKANPNSGMTLVSNNPIDIVLLGLREQDKLIMASDFLKDLHQKGLVQYVAPGAQAPAGWLELTDSTQSIFRRMALQQAQKGGKYYMPPDAAKLVNNHLSPGLRNNTYYRGFMQLGNTLNKFQLGASAFHLSMTSLEGAISQIGLAFNYLMEAGAQRRPDLAVKGLRAAAKAPIVPFEPAANAALRMAGQNRTGAGALIEEYRKPGTHPQVAYLAKWLARAGGAVDQEPIYRAADTRSVRRAVAGAKQIAQTGWNERNKLWQINSTQARDLFDRMHKLAQISGVVHGLVDIPSAVMEKSMAWLFEYAVPQQKVGAFLRMAEFEFDRLGPNATEDQLEHALQKSWDAVDNRFGQMVYDNKFWNRTAKDILHLVLRSVGWRAGTVAEFGSGIGDWGKAINKLSSGQKPEITHSMGWLVALPTVMGTIGGITTYLLTGERPKNIKDLFHPRIGQKDEQGRDKRIDFASYANDAQKVMPLEGESWGGRVGRYLKGGLNPGLTSALDLLQNMDWQRHVIMDRDGTPIEKGQDLLRYGIHELIPLAFEDSLPDKFAPTRSQYKGTTGPVTGTPLAQMFAKVPEPARREFGITPAPADLSQRPWERFAYDQGETGRTAGGVKEADAIKSQLRRDMQKALRFGDEKEFQRIFAIAQKRGIFFANEENKIRKSAAVPSSVTKFKSLNLTQKLTAYRYALKDPQVTPEIRAALRQNLFRALAHNYAKIIRLPDDNRDKIRIMTQLRLLGMLDENGDWKQSGDEE